MATYNNIPQSQAQSSTNETVKYFNTFYQVPTELNNTSLIAAKAFFESKGFGSEAAESVAIIILAQAKRDNLNPFTILDTLTGIDQVELSALVGEILNYNRFKTSGLGITKNMVPADEIQRNIYL